MKIVYIALLSVVMLFSQSTQSAGLRPSSENTLYAITGATVHTSASKSIKNATVLFENGKILSVGTKVKIPTRARKIDASGKHIYAGFIDLYSNYGLPKPKPSGANWANGPVYNNKRSGANAWNGAIHSEREFFAEFKPNAAAAKGYLGQGFTTVQSAVRDGVFRGTAFVANLNTGLANDNLIAASAMPQLSFSRGTSAQWYPHSLMGSIALLRQTFLDADWYTQAQRAYAKNPAQEKPEYNASLEALRGYNSKFFFFEANGLLNGLRADRVMDEFKVKGMILGSGHEYRRLADVKAMKRPLLMTLNLPLAPNVADVTAASDVSLEELRHHEQAPYNLAKLSKAKVAFALSLHRLKKKSDFWKNLRLSVKNGLSEASALRALTETPAKLLGLDKQLGTLSKGKFANFVITDKPIFNEKANIEDVWVAGVKHVIKKQRTVDYRGHYTLSWMNSELNLSVKGSKEKPSAQFSFAGKTYKTKKLKSSDALLQFSALIDTLSHNSINFELEKKGAELRGYASTESSAISPVRLTLDSAFVEKPKKEKKKKSENVMVSDFSFPNKSYGFKSLPKTETVLFKNATVWTSEKVGILTETDVLVRKGKISKVGKNLSAPKGAAVVDATGKHLTAGIIDEHSHIAINGGVNELSQSITAEVRIGDVVNSEDINIYRQLAGGVTASQLLHGSGNPIGGQAQVIKLRWGASPEQLKFKEAPASIKFALGENVKHSNFGDRYNIRYPQTRMGVKTLMEDGFNAALAYEDEWKKYNRLSSSAQQRTARPRKDLELEALRDIKNGKMFVHSHSYVQSEILMLMRLAESFGFRIQTFTHILEGYKVADEMAAHGATASTFADWWAYKFEVYDAITQNSTLMHNRGVVTSINSDDAEMARRLNQEAAKAVMYGGMSQEDAWKMVTINPAKQLKVDKYVGSIKEGKQADLVLWNNNPLSIYAKPLQTWIDGKKYFDIDRDAEMRKAQMAEKQHLIQKILNDGVKMKKNNVIKTQKMYHCVAEKTWYEEAYNGEAY